MPRFKLNQSIVCLLIFVLFFVLSFWFTKAPITHLGSQVPQGGDPLLVSWLWSWEMHQIPINPLDLFNANIFAPFKNTLAFTEHMLGSLLLAWPLFLLCKNIILVFNLISLSTFAISGLGLYLLAYHLTKNKSASFIAAFIYGFAPYKLIHLEHINLSGLWLPYFFLALHRLVADLSWRNVFLFLSFSLLVFLTAMQYALFLLPLVFIFLLFHWRPNFLHPTNQQLIKIIFIFLSLAVIVLPLSVPYLEIKNTLGFNRSVENVEGLSPDLIDYFISPFFYRYFYPSFFPEWVVGPGLVVWLLLLGSLWLIYRRPSADRRFLPYIFMGFFALLCSLGYYLQFTRSEIGGLLGPWAVFYHFLPGFAGIRAVGRFSVFFLLSASVIIAFGLSKILTVPVTRFSWLKKFFPLLILGLLFFEFSFVPTRKYVEVIAPPRVYGWLPAPPDANIYLELPLGLNQQENNWDTFYEYWSIGHFQKMVNGYSGFSPLVYQELNMRLKKFSLNADDLLAIKAYGVNRLIFHFDFYPPNYKDKVLFLLNNNQHAELIYHIDNDYIYQLR